MNRYEMYPGQTLRLIAPKAGNCLVKVLKVNPKNIKVQKEDGQVWNVAPSFLFETEPGEVFATLPEPAMRLVTGMVVKFTSSKMPQDLFVVIGEHGGAYRLSKLGGDGGRYYRGILSTQVEVVNFELAGV